MVAISQDMQGLLMLNEEGAIELGRRSVDEGWSVRQLEVSADEEN